MIRYFPKGTAALLAGLVSISLTEPSWALLTVESSTAPAIIQDTEFPNGHTFTVPEGAEISLFRTDDSTTHTIKGPYHGTLEDYIRRGCGLPTAGDTCHYDDGGGTRGPISSPGGVRAFKRPEE